jgi:hypothetical protein
MRAVLIANPVCGDDEPNAAKVPDAVSCLGAVGMHVDVRWTSRERSARLVTVEALAEGVDSFIVGGGDGTVSEVARELVGTPATLGILPIGTFNNIARSLGVPMDLSGACDLIIGGHIDTIDIGLLEGHGYFFFRSVSKSKMANGATSFAPFGSRGAFARRLSSSHSIVRSRRPHLVKPCSIVQPGIRGVRCCVAVG